MIQVIQPLVGLSLYVLLALALSEGWRRVDWRIIPTGIIAQLLLALLALKVPPVQYALELANYGVSHLINAVTAGTTFVFGFLGAPHDLVTQPSYPFDVTNPAGTFVFAFQILPVILVVTVLSTLLWHLGIMQVMVGGFSFLLRRTLRVGGAVGMASAASVFLGTVEAPALIQHYLDRMSRGELMIVLTAVMSTVAGSVMLVYAIMLSELVDNAIGHLLTASVISAPAAIMIARIMVPDTTKTDNEDLEEESDYSSVMDAIAQGTADGTRIMVNVGTMLIVFIALIAMINGVLGLLPDLFGDPVTLQRIFGFLFAPLALMMGIPFADCLTAGSLLGTKTVLNEFVAYGELMNLPEGTLSERSSVILTYGLCSFANFGTVGIVIGGVGGLCPERRGEIIELSTKALIAATLATGMTAAVVAILI